MANTWAVDRGSTPAAIGRRMLYHQLGGKEGVGGPDDLEVIPSSPTGPTVDLQMGQAAAINREPNHNNEMYLSLFDDPVELEEVPVETNGTGSTRYSLIVMRVEDPDMELTGDPLTYTDEQMEEKDFGFIRVYNNIGQYNPTVGAANVRKVQDLGLEISAIALARIRRLPGDGSVDVDDITDLRGVSNPTTTPAPENNIYETVADQNVLIHATNWDTFPDEALWSQLTIPASARIADIKVTVDGRLTTGAGTEGTITARLVLGSTTIASTTFKAPPNASERGGFFVGARNWSVPSGLRGTKADLKLELHQTAGSVTTTLKAGAKIDLDVKFSNNTLAGLLASIFD